MSKKAKLENGNGKEKEIAGRMDALVIVDAKNSNPNGDPNNGNRPRVSGDGRGLGHVMDVAIKRKLRNHAGLINEGKEGMGILCKMGTYQQDEERKYVRKEDKKEDIDIAQCCKDNFDVRAFGHVFTVGGNGNAHVQGAIVIGHAETINPIDVVELGIRQAVPCKRKMSTGGVESDTGKVGVKYIVPYGLYTFQVCVQPHLAAKNGLSEGDVDTTLNALMNMWETDASSARLEIVTRKIVLFRHESPYGNERRHKLFERIKIVARNEKPSSFGDYEISVDQTNLPDGISVEIME